MDDTRKLLLTDSGENHPTIKRQWLAAALGLFSTGLAFFSRWEYWRMRRQLDWLWDEAVTFPSFVDILVLALPIITVVLPLAIGRAINKMQVSVYDNGIEGYGLKPWDFWPRLHHFELSYNNIESIKRHKSGLFIRSTEGRYNLIIHNSERLHQKIIEQSGNTNGGFS